MCVGGWGVGGGITPCWRVGRGITPAALRVEFDGSFMYYLLPPLGLDSIPTAQLRHWFTERDGGMDYCI